MGIRARVCRACFSQVQRRLLVSSQSEPANSILHSRRAFDRDFNRLSGLGGSAAASLETATAPVSGRRESIPVGRTTAVDFFHNNRGPDFAHAAIRALMTVMI